MYRQGMEKAICLLQLIQQTAADVLTQYCHLCQHSSKINLYTVLILLHRKISLKLSHTPSQKIFQFPTVSFCTTLFLSVTDRSTVLVLLASTTDHVR